jgi:hypothetical protein
MNQKRIAAFVARIALATMAVLVVLKSRHGVQSPGTLSAEIGSPAITTNSAFPPRQHSGGSPEEQKANLDSASALPKVHSSLIERWTELAQPDASADDLRAFVQALDANQLLELAEFLCAANQFGPVQSLILPTLQRKWGRDVPFEALTELVATKATNPLFRTLLVDLVCAARGTATPVDRDLVATRLLPLAMDGGEDPQFRAHVIKHLSTVLQMGTTQTSVAGDSLLGLVTEPTTAPEVKGACITALRRIGDERALPLLADECRGFDDTTSDPLVARHAVVALAKYAKAADADTPIDAMRHVIADTTDARVYGSGVYAASLLNDGQFLELLPSIVSSMPRHETPTAQRSVISAVRKHEAAVIQALHSDDRQTLLAGVRACTLVSISDAREPLKAIASSLPEHRELIDQAIRKATLVE